MNADDRGDSPFDAVGETVDDQTAEAFELLGNETRLGIIVALWDAIEPTAQRTEESESGLSFSELRDQVGIRDSGQFNYHLNKLTDTFVDDADGTYTLTRSAHKILSAVIAGVVTDPPSFTDEPVDGDCPLCGGSVVIDYKDGTLSIRCTNCEGHFRGADAPSGLVMKFSREASGLMNRTPQEFFRHGNVSQRHTVLSHVEGVCLDCMGSVTATAQICETHEPEDNSLCPQCGRRNKIWWWYDCDVCKNRIGAPGWTPIYTETAVLSFCYERGLDFNTANDTFEWKRIYDAVDETLSARDPLEVTVTVELEGDRLTVILDDDAQVVDIEEPTR